MAIEIVAPGLGCTVQDQGRLGHYDVGIPPSGALDLFSAVAANLLLGNDGKAGVLEAAYMGPQLRFTDPWVVAVSAATMPITVGGQARSQWESFDVAAGDPLEFG